ncbi:MAG: hypothetical protein M5U28_05645 [Sandaracinaceae bacterium]|nr:hypothetical protein [Sandaracinaceae bacterium]
MRAGFGAPPAPTPWPSITGRRGHGGSRPPPPLTIAASVEGDPAAPVRVTVE